MDPSAPTKRWPTLILAFICGIALTIAILWLLWMFADRSIHMGDRPAILAAAADDLLADWKPNQAVYLREGQTWDVEKIISELRKLRPSLEVRPWAERPIYPPCGQPMPCGPEDNIYVEIDSEPYRRVAFVHFQESACRGDMILFRFSTSWRPLTKSMWCI